jgi:uncharacterized LabA/DUF88 family protein
VIFKRHERYKKRSCSRDILLGCSPKCTSKTAQNHRFEALGSLREPENRFQTDNLSILKPFFRYQSGQPYDRQVRSRVWKLEEKKTDVNLAMASYRDAAKGRYNQLVLCSNDSDAEPALQALREDFAQLQIGVVTPVPSPSLGKGSPRGVSTSLAQHAHGVRRYLLDGELANAQLPPQVPTHKKPVRKPAHW